MPRPEELYKLRSKDSSNLKQVTVENALVATRMPAAEFPEEGGHSFFLVVRARKIVRETAPGEDSCDFGKLTRRSANTGDIGTYGTMAVW